MGEKVELGPLGRQRPELEEGATLVEEKVEIFLDFERWSILHLV